MTLDPDTKRPRCPGRYSWCLALSLLKTPKDRESIEISRRSHTVMGMLPLLSALGSLLLFRVRSRASLELELVALRHQLTILRWPDGLLSKDSRRVANYDMIVNCSFGVAFTGNS